MDVEHRTDRAWVGLTKELIDKAQVTEFLTDIVSGGLCTFFGNTRAVTGRVVTTLLEYDCYPEMALKEMAALVDEASSSFGINRAVIIHRLGVVSPGESSVVVATSANHREATFAATRFLIDELKIRVPIWKKEYFSDGSSEWVGGE